MQFGLVAVRKATQTGKGRVVSGGGSWSQVGLTVLCDALAPQSATSAPAATQPVDELLVLYMASKQFLGLKVLVCVLQLVMYEIKQPPPQQYHLTTACLEAKCYSACNWICWPHSVCCS